MSESINNWIERYDIKVQQSIAREVLGGKTYAGPFSQFDCWSLVNYKFLADTLVYRLCLLANLMRPKGEEKEIDLKMWVEDPIAFAQCVSLSDLTVNTRIINARLEMMRKAGHPMWEEMMATKKTIFIPINYPTQDHWVAGNVICMSLISHCYVIYASFTNHLRVIGKSFESHWQVI